VYINIYGILLFPLEEYSAFLDDLGIGKKKVKVEEDKPYTPPMGDLRYPTIYHLTPSMTRI
jgi:hypothetical protein